MYPHLQGDLRKTMGTTKDTNPISGKNSWHANPALQDIPLQLHDLIHEVIIPSGLQMTMPPFREQESADYGAAALELEHQKVLFRVAHTTPTKIGQFVTLWKRHNEGTEIQPIDLADPIDYVFIAVFDTSNKGVFIFNKKILAQKDIISTNGKGGKRAMRVYAPWTKPLAKQAVQSQKWQIQHFLSMNSENETDLNLFHKIMRQT